MTPEEDLLARAERAEDTRGVFVDWDEQEACFVVTNAEEPGSIAKFRTRNQLAVYMEQMYSAYKDRLRQEESG